MLIEDDYSRDQHVPDGWLKTSSERKQVSAQFKFKDEFDFIVEVVTFILANHPPALRDLSPGMATRAAVILFQRVFFKIGEVAHDHPDRQRPELATRIYAAELSGVLRELVEGYYRVVKRGGYDEPRSAVAAREEWLRQASNVSRYADERLVWAPARYALALQAVYADYELYCKEAGVSERVRTGRHGFGDRLLEVGFAVRRGGANARQVVHARMTDPVADSLPPRLGGFANGFGIAVSCWGPDVWNGIRKEFGAAPHSNVETKQPGRPQLSLVFAR
jgi:phage/plasmid-associated DNA primase